MKKRLLLLLVSLTATSFIGFAVNGYDLWLGTGKQSHSITISSSTATPTINIAKQEFINGWEGASGKKIRFELINDPSIKEDGFRISSTRIQAKTDIGILYGVYDYLRKVKTGCSMDESVSNPSYRYRILNHWDNLDGSIERGYAGKSIFWRGVDQLGVTEEDRERWRDYARANASIGINGTVLNNVNASPEVLRHDVLSRVGTIADVLRPYGIRVFLSINFSSPAQLGHLKTSDPLNKEVITWWQDKVKEIYALIPDFGGFLVKANSEGLPGPQDYGRTHADGANLLAML
jgi:alpha-glucuronidase